MKKPTPQPAADGPVMVRVRMLCVMSGTDPLIGPGDVISFESDEANRLVSIGAAVILDDDEDEQE